MSDLKPLERTEFYLDAIAEKLGGNEVEVPEPQTREEYFLKKIVDNASSGGGGGDLTSATFEENGTFKAEDFETVGWNEVTVNVSGGSELADFVVVNNTSSQISVWCNKIDSNNCVVYAPETINANSQKTLKTTVSPDEKKASGFIEIHFGGGGTAVGKTVSVTNGVINFQANKPNTNPSGIVILVEQSWLPSEAPIITVS